MKKVDIPCFLLSLSLCCVILYLLSYEPISLEAEELKIGLVEIENSNSLESDGTSKTDASPQEEETLSDQEQVQEQKQEEEIRKPSLEELKKSISKPKLDSQNVRMDSFDKKNSVNNGIGTDVDKILSRANGQAGLPSGSRMGSIDGTALVHWESTNQEPIFPEIAKKTGKNGSVVLIIGVNEAGNVISVRMERGSGVPEINEAIEKVARTWKVKLVKNNKSVGGNFVLKYNFYLK